MSNFAWFRIPCLPAAVFVVVLLRATCSSGDGNRSTAFVPCADANTVAALQGSRCTTVEVFFGPAADT